MNMSLVKISASSCNVDCYCEQYFTTVHAPCRVNCAHPRPTTANPILHAPLVHLYARGVFSLACTMIELSDIESRVQPNPVPSDSAGATLSPSDPAPTKRRAIGRKS